MKIGNQVSVVDEDLDGIVTSVHGNTVIFRDEFGFSHRYSKEKLVLKNASLYENINVEKKTELSKPVSRKHSKNVLILDLHFEKLVKNSADYGSFERLFLQKEKLLETLEFCRKNKIKKLEIIHGIGDGVLQKMVVDMLKSQTGLDFRHREILPQQSGAILVDFP